MFLIILVCSRLNFYLKILWINVSSLSCIFLEKNFLFNWDLWDKKLRGRKIKQQKFVWEKAVRHKKPRFIEQWIGTGIGILISLRCELIIYIYIYIEVWVCNQEETELGSYGRICESVASVARVNLGRVDRLARPIACRLLSWFCIFRMFSIFYSTLILNSRRYHFVITNY